MLTLHGPLSNCRKVFFRRGHDVWRGGEFQIGHSIDWFPEQEVSADVNSLPDEDDLPDLPNEKIFFRRGHNAWRGGEFQIGREVVSMRERTPSPPLPSPPPSPPKKHVTWAPTPVPSPPPEEEEEEEEEPERNMTLTVNVKSMKKTVPKDWTPMEVVQCPPIMHTSW